MNNRSAYDIEPGMESPLDFAVTRRDSRTLEMVEHSLAAGRAVLAYQPVMQARAPSEPAFHEGLIRILDSTGRLIPAHQFIDVTEARDTGRRIDCIALRDGLATLADHPALRLSVNMSARSIGYGPWLQVLEEGLARDETAAERLILEITESSAILMPDVVSAFMARLRARGISFALDDFGAGFTSFRYLRDLLFDIVKIDGQFIRGIATNSDNQVLAQALVDIACHFDMVTVAESVENAADAEWLIGMGVDCLQGYLFAAPTARPDWLRNERKLRA